MNIYPWRYDGNTALPIFMFDTVSPNRLFIKKPSGSIAELVSTEIEGDANFTVRMKDAASGPGKTLQIFGQNTDAGSIGGMVKIAGGFGFDTFGVIISERIRGSDNTNDIAQFFGEAGIFGQMTCVGGSNGTFQLRFPSVLGQIGGSAQVIIDCGNNGGFIRANSGSDTCFRWANGPAIGFYGTAPVAKPTVTGAKGGNAALTSLIAALVAEGLITDSTT